MNMSRCFNTIFRGTTLCRCIADAVVAFDDGIAVVHVEVGSLVLLAVKLVVVVVIRMASITILCVYCACCCRGYTRRATTATHAAHYNGRPASKRVIIAYAGIGLNVGTSCPLPITVANRKSLDAPPYCTVYPTTTDAVLFPPARSVTHGRQSFVTGNPSAVVHSSVPT